MRRPRHPDLIDDPRFAHNQDRTANREQLRPLLVERLATRSKMEWFRDLTAAGVPCGPINTIDGGVAFAEEMGHLDPVVDAGHGEHAVPGIRNPIRFSHTPHRATSCRHQCSTSTVPRSAGGWRPSTQQSQPEAPMPGSELPTFPTSIGTSDLTSINLLGQDLAHDLMGQVSFGELAFWLVAQRRPTPGQLRVFEAVLVALADHGFTPTAIAARLTYLERTRLTAGSGRGRAARRRLPLPRRHRGLRPFLADALAGRPEQPAETPDGTNSPPRSSAKREQRAGSSPVSATRSTRAVTRAPRR